MNILLLSDIHGNYPALEAVNNYFKNQAFDLIFNCGDSVVYGPYPNETLAWLEDKKAVSILGNTDKKVIKILKGKIITKPSNPEKRVMYTWTAEILQQKQTSYLLSLPKRKSISFDNLDYGKNKLVKIGLYHGSPEYNHEFLFDITPQTRFEELSELIDDHIVCCGHSHTPFHKVINNIHFINPGSVGRMFDGDPSASCATLTIKDKKITLHHHRIIYDIQKTIDSIKKHSLPEIYCAMFLFGRKLN